MDSRLVRLLVVSLVVTACANGNARDGATMRNDLPPPIALNLSGRCEDVSGSYRNAGVALRSQVVQNPQLAESLFRLVLPSKDGYPRQAQSVRVSVDPGAMMLRITVVGDGASREWSTRYECRDGWMHVRDDDGKQYLGDGVTQEWSKRVVLLAVDADGNLVAHTTSELEYRVFLGGRHRSHGEGWYLFRRQGAD
jgi:hypothetical protein